MLKKPLLVCFAVLPIIGHTNTVHENWLIGKWQCTIKDSDSSVNQMVGLQFFNNHTLHEDFRITYGQKDSYDYQIETAFSQSTWEVVDDMLNFNDYKILNYKVRMPNAKKDDMEQAVIAMQKSLPIIQKMLNHEINTRQFAINFAHKKSFILNDMNNQLFISCDKKSWFHF